ncbi:hypothetical protein C437_15311 [Haloarcula vallismortis ATCC 29715]|uniref:Uncharacterized protein n=1 Tax=Haloarcula vallismortis ATCC 29715 TaxID=662477 RepID=M0J236_HALVA|nr:hypothetical protein [Haloarcula vallismortis]EMA01800.1 hypothetical protein C437_15311 [Haloarcula vallismortis ATCC 29715]
MASNQSKQSKRYTVEISDPKLREHLDSAENKSETIRDAIRTEATADGTLRMADLSDDELTAYEWLDEQGGRVELETAETHIAQLTQVEKKLVRRNLLRPLSAMGLLEADTRMWGVDLVTIAPVECGFCEADIPPNRVDEHISENHSWGGR